MASCGAIDSVVGVLIDVLHSQAHAPGELVTDLPGNGPAESAEAKELASTQFAAAAVRSCDPHALIAVALSHKRELRYFIYQITRNYEAMHNIIADVCIRVLEGRVDECLKTTEHMRRYVFMVARHLAFDWLDRQRHRKKVVSSGELHNHTDAMKGEADPRSRSAAERLAMAWLLEFERGAPDSQHWNEFEHWLAADPLNERMYLQFERRWKSMVELPEWEAGAADGQRRIFSGSAKWVIETVVVMTVVAGLVAAVAFL